VSENFIFAPVSSKGFPVLLVANYSSDHDTPTVTAKVPFAITSQTPARAEWRIDFQGKVYTGEGMNAEAVWDTRNGLGHRVAPGLYTFDATETFYYDSGARPSLTVSGTVEVRRGDIWPFGYNWMTSYDTLLVDSGSAALIIQGDGQHLTYARQADGTYRVPDTDFSTLVKNGDGTWKRTSSQGVVESFNSLGRLTRMEDRNGNAQTLAYEPNGVALPPGRWGLTTRLTAITDPSGRVTTLTYGGDGYVSRVTDPTGRQYSLGHDASGNLTSISDPLGRVTSYEYDANHLLVRYVYPKGSATTLAYDSQRRMTSHTDALGKSRSALYGDGQNTFTDERGVATIYRTNQTGAITQVINPVQTVNYTYDERRQLTAIDQPPQQFAYDAQSNLTSYTGYAQATTAYDTFSQPVVMTDQAGNSTQFTYDAAGNLTRVTDALGKVYQMEYDSAGQLTRVIDPLNRATTFTYDAFGNVVGQLDRAGFASSAIFNNAGNLTQTTDAEGRATQFAYDAMERLTSATNALGRTTQYVYDAHDNLTSFTDARNNATTYAYDALDRLTQKSDPLGKQTKYAYDGVGNLTSLTDAAGGVKNFTYDAAGRLMRAQIAGGEAISYTYDAIGQMIGVFGAGGRISYAYPSGITGSPDVVESRISALPGLTSRVNYNYVSVGGGGAASVQNFGPSGMTALPAAPPPPNAEAYPGASTAGTAPPPAPVADAPNAGAGRPDTADRLVADTPGASDARPDTAGLAVYTEQPAALATNVCGTLTSNTTWTLAASPYVATCDVVVNAGITLTIDPGVVVKFQSYYEDLWVFGTLIADGTPQARIYFTSAKDDSVGGDSNGDGSATSPAPNDWSSLRFLAGSSGSVLDNAVVRYAGGDWYESVYIQTRNITFTNNTITRSGENGLRLDNVLPPALTGNSFINNTNSAIWAPLSNNGDSITLSGNSASGNQLNGFVTAGTIAGSVTWDGDDGFPFLAWEDIVVNANASLTLLPGTIVKFHDYYDDLWVYGRLIADTTANAPIYFTSAKDDSVGGDSNSDGSATTPAPNDWSSLRFLDGSSGSVVNNALIRYGGGDWYEIVYIQTRSITFTNNLITRSGENGLRLDNVLPASLTGNSFLTNTNSAVWAPLSNNGDSIVLNGNRASGNGLNGFVTAGTIAGTVTWDGDDGLPFITWEDIVVNANASLTLTPGTIVKFHDYYDDLWVYGTLSAHGTDAQPILFTSLHDHSVGGTTGTGNPAPNDWSSIRMMAGSSGVLDHVTARYGGGDWYETIYLNSANLTLTDSAIRASGERGITIDGVSPTLTGNAIRANVVGVYATNGANPVLHNNQISGNSQYGFLNVGGAAKINAEQNWWGSGSGPLDPSDDRASGGLYNPSGGGDRVSDGVDYDPWLQLSGLLYSFSIATGNNPVQTVAYTYDQLNRITRLDASGPASFSFGHTFDAAGQLTAMGAIDGSAGVSTTLQYDAVGRLTRLINRSANGSTLFGDLRQSYDKVGNILSIQNSAGTTNYTYDALYQLTGTAGPGLNESYSYDAVGNRTAKNGVTYAYNAANQLVSASDGSSYLYDANGSLTSKSVGGQTTRYTWDGYNRLTRIDFADGSHAAYTYDADGRRLSKRERSGQMLYFIYEGLNLVQELNAAGGVIASYVYDRLDQPISMTRDNTTYYYLYDHLGNVVGLSDGANSLVATYRYDPWGNLIATGGSNPALLNPFRFTGREWDAESGLYYYRARYYDPQIGRFLSQDPLHLATAGLHNYAYADNNPLRYVDPSGLLQRDWRRFWQAVGGIAVGGATALLIIGTAPVSLPGLVVGAAAIGGGTVAGGVTGIGIEWAGTEACDPTRNYGESFKQGLKGGFAGASIATIGGMGFRGELLGTSLEGTGTALWTGGGRVAGAAWRGTQAVAGGTIEAVKGLLLFDSTLPTWALILHRGNMALAPLFVYASLQYDARRNRLRQRGP